MAAGLGAKSLDLIDTLRNTFVMCIFPRAREPALDAYFESKSLDLVDI